MNATASSGRDKQTRKQKSGFRLSSNNGDLLLLCARCAWIKRLPPDTPMHVTTSHTHTHSYTTALLICIDCVRQSTFYSMFRVISIRNDGRDAVDWQRLEKSGPFSFFAFDARICLIGRGHLSLIKIWNSNFESNESIFVAARIAHFIIIFRNKEQRTTIYDFQLMWNRRSTFQWIAESRVITLWTFFTSNFR